MVAEHLYRQGCRKLLYLNPGHWTGMQSDSRGISFRRQGEQMGMQVKEYCATWEEHKRLDYHKTILEVLEKNPDADGIFCHCRGGPQIQWPFPPFPGSAGGRW